MMPGRWLVMAALLVACGAAPTKAAPTVADKCNAGPDREWRVAYTEYWTTEEPTYGLKYNWQTGEYEFGQTGTETVDHSRDVYGCMARR